jgi:hypothetical protein
MSPAELTHCPVELIGPLNRTHVSTVRDHDEFGARDRLFELPPNGRERRPYVIGTPDQEHRHRDSREQV